MGEAKRKRDAREHARTIYEPTGSLAVLNVGGGDVVVTFDGHSADETDEALAMLEDMQRKGYAILIRVAEGVGDIPPRYARVAKIDRDTREYVYFAEQRVPVGDPVRVVRDDDTSEMIPAEPEQPKRRGRRAREQRAPISKSHAVGVARSAGG